MDRTYLDAGVLIEAVRGPLDKTRRVEAMLGDPNRLFVASAFLRLEILPKALHYRRRPEAAFYEAYFRSVAEWAEPLSAVVLQAEEEARRFGLSALDALHVASAVLLDADELITTESLGKPIHRVTSVRVVRL